MNVAVKATRVRYLPIAALQRVHSAHNIDTALFALPRGRVAQSAGGESNTKSSPQNGELYSFNLFRIHNGSEICENKIRAVIFIGGFHICHCGFA